MSIEEVQNANVSQAAGAGENVEGVSCRRVVAVALVGALSGKALAQPSNSEVGTWKLNVAKSKFSPGTALKSGTVK
jgi:hypothetical protein